MRPTCASKNFPETKNLLAETFSERIALITGGSSGLGFEAAKILARGAYRVIVVGRDKKRLLKAQRLLAEESRANVATLAADVAEDSFGKKLAALLKQEKIDRIDLVIHAAGINHIGTLAETRLDNATRTFRINTLSVITITQATKPYLLRAKHPHFVLVSSLMQYFARPARSVYAASKAAAEIILRTWESELIAERCNIKVQIFRPAGIDTDFHSNTATDGDAPRSHISRMSAPRAARYLVELAESNRHTSAPGVMNKIAAFTARYFPRVAQYFARRR